MGKNLVRDPGYGRRFSQACDASPHCPPMNHGRYEWLRSELAKKLGKPVSAENVRRWINGESKPRQAVNDNIAEILGVDSAWLYLGLETNLTQRDRKARNAEADGAVNVVAGFIRMDGGNPAFPEESDKRAQRNHIDVYSVIRGANYAFHITVGRRDDEASDWMFAVPVVGDDGPMMLGVVRDGFSVQIVEIDQSMVERSPIKGSARLVSVDRSELDDKQIRGFTQRL